MNQAAHQRQADAQTAFGALQRRGRLREHLENLLEHLRRDSDPVVGDRDHGLIRFDSHAYLDCAARIGVLDGVAQQITDDLTQANLIGVHVYRLFRNPHRQLMTPRIDLLAHCFYCCVDDFGHIDPLNPQLHETVRNARDIEQVIEQAGHVIDLPLQGVARQSRDGRFVGRFCEQVRSCGERGERIAQFMRENGEEFVLAATSLLQRVFRTFLLCNVHEYAYAAAHASLFIEKRTRVLEEGRHAAVIEHDIELLAHHGLAKTSRPLHRQILASDFNPFS